jgi:hypothetical protein
MIYNRVLHHNKGDKSMKQINILLIMVLLALGVTNLLAQNKRYHVKSGVVEYKMSGGGSIFGIKNETKGTSKLIFKDWGNIELTDEKSTSTTMGKTDVVDKITKIDNGKVYSVDKDRKVITVFTLDMLKQSKDMTKMGKDMLKSVGGKKIGTGKVLGYTCEIWEALGSKIWIYKGVTLKVEASIMGIKSTQIATKAKFNINISDSKFKLPPYPIKTMDQMINEGASQHQNVQPKPKELEQLQDFMKNFSFGQ